ncbi:hypothetical protein L2E82_24828 [Cichorium intybus]|uniref:Uncharacterized protein n=1 Tax=Cichorium intybus TaxID=13427 RepID=A0ACB9E208_CICIN|nr:hypothetical protein L2E82_24828 [Cichorium intybus]
MASTSGISTFVIIPLLIIIIAIINLAIVSAVRESELNVVFGVLRARGYHLFANAIVTSDIHYDIKSDSSNFTLFAPINSALFAIDMTMAASNYVEALRYHVVPRRMSITDLLSLPPGANSIPTLMPGQNILVEQRRDPRSLITVGGVDIVVPGMFYGRDIAVHGLDGILEFRPHTRNSLANTTHTPFPNNQTSMNVYPYNMPPPNTTQEGLPPLDFNPTGNISFQFPQEVSTTPDVSSSDLSPKADGIAMDFTPSPNQSPSASANFAEEQMSRAKLLEFTYASELLRAAEQTRKRLQEFTSADDEAVDCSLADHGCDQQNDAIHA